VTITRKRTKTESKKSTPTVTYVLWPQTAELVNRNLSDDAVLCFTTNSGMALNCASLVEGKFKQSNAIQKAWHREGLPMLHKALRSHSATLLEAHEVYRRDVGFFLGHAPASMAEKHYAAPSQVAFNSLVEWLGKRYFGE